MRLNEQNLQRMSGMWFGNLAVIALILSLATAAHAEVAIPKGKCAFIVASRSSIDEVNSFLAGVDDSLHRNLQVVESSNGWYAISVGVIPEDEFDDIKARRVAAGIVPADSLCSKGTKYTRVLDEDEYVLPVKVDVSNWVPVGPNAPSLAPTGRAPIAFKRPLREGEAVIPLCPKKGLGCQFVDETGAALTDRVFDSAAFFGDEDIAAVLLGEKWGYINTSGAWVVEPKFDEARDFASNGLARVKLGEKWGYINSSGAWVVEPKFDDAAGFAEDNLARVKIGSKWGYINLQGAWRIAPEFDEAYGFDKNGLARVKLGERWGFINDVGVWAIEPKFEYAGDFSTDVALVRAGGLIGFINQKGDFVIPPKYTSAYDFSEGGFAPVEVTVGQGWGIIDSTGRFLVQPTLDLVYGFNKYGLAPVLIDSKWGYIDNSGNIVIKPKYDYAHWGAFDMSGLAFVKIGEKWGYINTSGEWVVEPLYDSVAQVAGGLFRVDYGNGQFQGLLKPDGTPLTFSQEEFRMAEIEGNQKRLEEELAKKDEEIKRLQEEAANAQAAAASAPQVSSACDHVYVGKLFEGKMGVAGQLFGLKGTYEVLGFSANTEQVTITLTTDRSFRQQITCSQVPY